MSDTIETQTRSMNSVEQFLVNRDSPTYAPYYNGKMSYTLRGTAWETYVSEAFPNLKDQQTSENVFKSVIDLYAMNLVPVPDELRGFSQSLVPLLSRGECPVVVDSAGTPHFPEHYEMISDGLYTVTAIYTRSLKLMQDYVTFVTSDGQATLFTKDVPTDLGPATKEGYQYHEEHSDYELFRFALDDKGFGASLAALQDRLNHSIIDQTVIAEMYARPFWYLLKFEMPPTNPYLPKTSQVVEEAMKEHKADGATGRIFTTSAEGPFGQLTPPTINDMIGYHDSIVDKVPQSFGIPGYFFKPGTGTPPTGVALKVLSKRFNTKVSRMRDDIEPELERLADLLGVEKTKEVVDTQAKPKGGRDSAGTLQDDQQDAPEDTQPDMEYEFWGESDDLLQEALDAHGIALSTMGYPLKYIAEVVTPGVDLDEYEDDSMGEPIAFPPAPGEPTDMTAMGQKGTPATPGQVKAYEQNPGQRAKA